MSANQRVSTSSEVRMSMVYRNSILFLQEACIRTPSRREVARLEQILEGYLYAMSSGDAVAAIVGSLECRKILLELSYELGLNEDSNLRNALRIDEELIATLLVSIFDSKSDEELVLGLEGDSAQYFLDAVQESIDRGFLITPNDSKKARRIIRKLSESCDKLPSSLFVTGITGREERATFGGGFGDIFRACYGTQTVALKRMRCFARGEELRRIRLKFYREALVWKDLQHPNILTFLGIDRDSFPSELCMVSPWMEHGTVLDYLKAHRHADVYKLLLEIVQGLEYLHSQNIIHGDLRGANILITENSAACLADFGLSVFTDATASVNSDRAGCIYWMAPELIDPERFGCSTYARSSASDVYAFGCVCLELCTGLPPFSELSHPAAMLGIIAGQRAERPPGNAAMSDVLWNYVTTYWAESPAMRPSTMAMVQHMAGPALRGPRQTYLLDSENSTGFSCLETPSSRNQGHGKSVGLNILELSESPRPGRLPEGATSFAPDSNFNTYSHAENAAPGDDMKDTGIISTSLWDGKRILEEVLAEPAISATASSAHASGQSPNRVPLSRPSAASSGSPHGQPTPTVIVLGGTSSSPTICRTYESCAPTSRWRATSECSGTNGKESQTMARR